MLCVFQVDGYFKKPLSSSKGQSIAALNQYECSVCSKIYKGFSGRRNLTGHLFKVHGIGKPYTCECGEEFVWDNSYYKHRKICGKALMTENDFTNAVEFVSENNEDENQDDPSC